MFKILAITLMILISSTASAKNPFFSVKNADVRSQANGCLLDGKIFKAGTRKQMNAAELKRYKELTGYRASDGHAVMMECLYLVNPAESDHPKVDEREYVWVAS
jgi:hypothetical protein